MNTLVALGAVWLLVYTVACSWWPYVRHGRCGGTGRLRSPTGKAFRPCPGCDDGIAIRAGRRGVEWFRHGSARSRR